MLTLVAVLIAGVVTLTDAEVAQFKVDSQRERAVIVAEADAHIKETKQLLARRPKKPSNAAKQAIAKMRESIAEAGKEKKRMEDKTEFVRPRLGVPERGSVGSIPGPNLKVVDVLENGDAVVQYYFIRNTAKTLTPSDASKIPVVVNSTRRDSEKVVVRGLILGATKDDSAIRNPGVLFKVTGTAPGGSKKYPLLEPVDEADLQKRLAPAAKAAP